MPHMADPNSGQQKGRNPNQDTSGAGSFPSPSLNPNRIELQPTNVQSPYTASPRHLSPGSASMAGLVAQSSPNVYAQLNVPAVPNGAAVASAVSAQQRANSHRMAMQRLPSTPPFVLNPAGRQQQQNYSDIMKSAAQSVPGRSPMASPHAPPSPSTMQVGSPAGGYHMPSMRPPMPPPKSHHPFPTQMTDNRAMPATSSPMPPNIKPASNPHRVGLSPHATGTTSSALKAELSSVQHSGGTPRSTGGHPVTQSPFSTRLTATQTAGKSPNIAPGTSPSPAGLILRTPSASAATTTGPSPGSGVSRTSKGGPSTPLVQKAQANENLGSASSTAAPAGQRRDQGSVPYRSPLPSPAKTGTNTRSQKVTAASRLTTPQRTYYKSSPKTYTATRITPKPNLKLRGGHYSKPGTSSSSAPYGYPTLKITADQIMEAMPENASSIFHIMDRRINFDALPPDASFYSLLRAWVQDDPYRKIPPSGSNLLEYADLPSERRVEFEDAVHTVGSVNRKRKLEECDVLSKTAAVAGPSVYSLRSSLISRAKQIRGEKCKKHREKDANSVKRLKELGVALPRHGQ